MPYSKDHKQKTRARIIEVARVLFNRHGFQDVTINRIMAEANLTRGGFYNHFKSKEVLYQAAVSSFLMGRGAQWRSEVGVDANNPGPDMARQMIEGYLSSRHLGDLDGQCPMIALPSDIARANPQVQTAYQELLTAMVSLFEGSLDTSPNNSDNDNINNEEQSRQQALSLAALCVGGMILARTLPDSDLANEVREAALAQACCISGAA